jgi:mRNA-degrading endonuclease RelE of RelBE toxin-antitoxin system
MRFMITDTFQKSLAALDPNNQDLVKRAAFDFQMNPAQPGAQLHRVDRVRDKRWWSFRVNRDMRIIVFRDEATVMLCYADHHDKAYSWAKNRQLEANAQTGAMQLVEVVERVEEVVKRVTREVEEEPPLFARFERDYLQALGVPERWLDALQHVGEEGFLRLVDHLPAEASENLMKLAQGQPVPRPVRLAAEDPFAHPDAQRRFRVVDGDQALLRRALDAPWDQWTVFLHPSQRDAAIKSYSGPAKVSGGAGTGKTVVALHRAAQLSRRRENARVLLTTFSRTLASRLEHHLDLLLEPGSAERGRVEVAHLHRLAKRLWEERSGRVFKPLTTKELMGRLGRLAREKGVTEFSTAFLRLEWEGVIEAEGVTSWDAYKSVRRAGRGIPLGVRQRLQVWRVFEALQKELQRAGVLSFDRLLHETRELLHKEEEALFDHVIADEVQDFAAPELRLLRALAKPGPDDVFVAGDMGQRIYKAGSSFSANGLEVRGRSTILRLNYRTTEQIRRYADGLLPEILTDSDGESEARDTVSLLTGPRPQVVSFTDPSDEVRHLAERLEAWLQGGFTPGDIAVFARTNAVLQDRAQSVLDLCGLEGNFLTDEDPPRRDRVSLGTMHRAKGLEFRVVVLVGCGVDHLPLAGVLRGLGDAAARAQFFEQERNLFYVACTRAREQLLITYVGAASVFLADKCADPTSPLEPRS